MIPPTPGRIVHYWPSQQDPTPVFKGEPLAAIITRVHHDREVNLTVFRADGVTYGRHNVRLLQDKDKPPADGGFAEWMDFQKGQAAKTEAAEAAARATG